MTTPNTAKGQSSADRLADAAEALLNSGLYNHDEWPLLRCALAAYLKEKERPIETPSLLASKTADSSEITDTQRLDWLDQQGKAETFEDADHSTVWCIMGETGVRALRVAIDTEILGHASQPLTPPPTGDGAGVEEPSEITSAAEKALIALYIADKMLTVFGPEPASILDDQPRRKGWELVKESIAELNSALGK